MIIYHFVGYIIPLSFVIFELVIGSWIVLVQDNWKTSFWFAFAGYIWLLNCICCCCCWIIGFVWKLLFDCWYGKGSTKGLDIWLFMIGLIFGKGFLLIDCKFITLVIGYILIGLINCWGYIKLEPVFEIWFVDILDKTGILFNWFWLILTVLGIGKTILFVTGWFNSLEMIGIFWEKIESNDIYLFGMDCGRTVFGGDEIKWGIAEGIVFNEGFIEGNIFVIFYLKLLGMIDYLLFTTITYGGT